MSSLPASMKKIRSKIKALECSQHFPNITIWELIVAWKPEFQSYLVQNLMQSIPRPNDASDKIWLRLAHWLWRYSSLKMFTDTQTDTQTDRQTDDGSTGIL